MKKKNRVRTSSGSLFYVFFFNDTATTEIYTLSLHDALPICPIQIDALTDVQVLYLDFDPLLLQQECACPHKAQVTANLLREMGRSALFLNQKMRILAQNRLRNRIKLYLQMLPVKPGGELHLDMGRGELADYLCVDRSALSRELGRMQKEGILAFQGQQVRILDQSFLSV